MLKNKLIISLKGGFGNQLFQVVNGINLSKKFNKKLVIDLSSFNKMNFSRNTKRNYELDFLNFNYEKINYLSFFFKFYSKFSKNLVYIKEKNFNFHPIVLEENKSYFIEGYWQSYKYFENNKSDICKFFDKTKNNLIHNSFSKIIKRYNSVCVHIRRGDYVNDINTNRFHGLCDINYYKKAIALMKERTPNAKFFFFSDDIHFLNKNFGKNKDYIIVSNEKNNLIDEFVMMLSCNNFILANSSFSWWAAFLSSNFNKTVIAPSKWFNANINTSDLIPKEWIQI